MNGYTKLFGSIIASTIWRESKETKIVWITMLAMANKFGVVEASVPGLADFSRVTLQECEKALKTLSEPDPYSRTKEHEGRRIEDVDGGWRLLNHAKYREKMSADDRREYLRIKQQEHRDKSCQHGVNSRIQMSTPSTHADADADADAKAEGRIAIAIRGNGALLVDLMAQVKELLGDGEWKSRHKRWMNRAESAPAKLQRVLAEVAVMAKEGRINTTPARAAEDVWKRF